MKRRPANFHIFISENTSINTPLKNDANGVAASITIVATEPTLPKYFSSHHFCISVKLHVPIMDEIAPTEKNITKDIYCDFI